MRKTNVQRFESRIQEGSSDLKIEVEDSNSTNGIQYRISPEQEYTLFAISTSSVNFPGFHVAKKTNIRQVYKPQPVI